MPGGRQAAIGHFPGLAPPAERDRILALRAILAQRRTTAGIVRRGERPPVKRSMLEDVDAAILGQHRDLRARIAVPDEIAYRERRRPERNRDLFGLRVAPSAL